MVSAAKFGSFLPLTVERERERAYYAQHPALDFGSISTASLKALLRTMAADDPNRARIDATIIAREQALRPEALR